MKSQHSPVLPSATRAARDLRVREQTSLVGSRAARVVERVLEAVFGGRRCDG